MLKLFGDLFYLAVALFAAYSLRGFFRSQRTINSTIIKTHVTAYEIQKMIAGRTRQA